MLEQLLTNPQKKLLRVLLSSPRSFSVLDLARLAALPYSTTHATLRTLQKAGLVVSKAERNKVLHALAPKNGDAGTVLDLLARELAARRGVSLVDPKKIADKEVLWNLAGLGAPLVVDRRPGKPLPPEQTLALALNVVRRNPTAARVLPLALAKSLPGLNFPLLRHLSKEQKETRTLGFFLDLTGTLSRKTRFKKLAAELFDRRVKRDAPFFQTSRSRYARILARRRTPPLARKWRFTMNLDMSDFRSVFDKFYDRTSKIQPPRH